MGEGEREEGREVRMSYAATEPMQSVIRHTWRGRRRFLAVNVSVLRQANMVFVVNRNRAKHDVIKDSTSIMIFSSSDMLLERWAHLSTETLSFGGL